MMADPRPPVSALAVDLYELTMAQSYFRDQIDGPATFSLFARHLPAGRGFFVAAGLDDVLTYLEEFRFLPEELSYLGGTGLFAEDFLDYLGRLAFTGSVRALPEGTVHFPNEPVVEVSAPLIEAQLVETAVLNLVHFQTIIASKAARCVVASAGHHRLVDFGLRRTHSLEAGLRAARASYLAGFDATSNVQAGSHYGIPIAGTMAHSYVEIYDDELDAFRSYARCYPESCILLVDTYDTPHGVELAAVVGGELASAGHRLRGVRLDSGDLIDLSFQARSILDKAGLADAAITASGSVDEHLIAEAVARGAPIDSFGVGTKLDVSADAPYLDMAYKLVEYDRAPRLKLSEGKATWPGPKQVWRSPVDSEVHDLVGLADEPGPPDAKALLQPVMADGRALHREPLSTSRERAHRELQALPAVLIDLQSPAAVTVQFSQRLTRLRDQLAQRALQKVSGTADSEPRSHVGVVLDSVYEVGNG